MVSVNKATCETTGYGADELLGRSPIEFVIPEHRAVAAARMQDRLAGVPIEQVDLDILAKDGRRVSMEIRGRTLYDGDPVSGAFEIARDITDRKRAEEELAKTREQLQHVLSFSPAIIYLCKVENETFKPQWVSESLNRLTGYKLGEALSEGWWMDNIHPEDRDRVLAGVRSLFDQDRVVLEYRFRHKDGGYLWLRDEPRLLRDESGNPVELIGSWVDVTERREAEVALRDSEVRFRTLVSSMDDMVFTVGLDQRHTGAFGRWIERFGLERRDLIGRTASEIFGVDDSLVHDQAYARALTGEQVIYEWSMSADRETRHFQTSLSPIRDQSGKVTGLVGVGRDSTEHKRAGEALLASEERYRELVENARDIIYSHDLEGNYTSANKAVEQITGYTRDEALRMNLAQTIAPEYLEKARQMITSKLANQKETVYDLEIIAKDGHRVKVEVNTRLVFQDDVPVGIQGIARDVTERKRAEEALRDSQERFRRYFELGLIGMSITSPTRGYLEVNDHLCEMLGCERSELLNRTWSEFTHPDDLAANVVYFNLVLAGELDGYTLEKRFIRKDGQVVHANISVKCVRCADGSVDYFVALTQDITVRKEAERALRESQAHLQAILDNCPAMIFLKDPDGRYLQVNPQFERTFDLTTEQVLSRTDAEIFSPELAAAFRATDRIALEAGGPLEFEESAIYASGPHTYLVHKFPLQDSSGNVYAVGGISTDITARKRAEDDLRKQKEILQKVFDHIPIMIALFDDDGRFKLVNREWERTLGWSLKAIETQTPDIFAELYPDPQDRMEVQKFIGESNAEWADFKTKVRDGQVINTSWASVYLSDGTNMGIGRDISERKRADDLLRRQTAQLAALHEIGLKISAESELSRVLDVATRRAAELLNANHCSVYIRDREQSELNLVAALQDDLIGLRVKEGEELAGRVALLGNSQTIDDYSQWYGQPSLFDDKVFGPSLGAPLKWQHTVIGVIILSRKKDSDLFTNADLEFLEQIASELAIAIHQTTLFEEVQDGQRRLQVLSHRLIDAQEAERKRLARELHDQIGQALTAVQISLQTLQSSPHNSSAKLLEDSLAIIDEAIQQVHDLSLDLRPSLLDDLGLVAALRWYVGRVASRAGLVHGFKADGMDARLAPEVETACFRIAQEALTNVLRHASATNVSVEITSGQSDLRLLVRDNGVGFDVRAAMSRTGLSASLGLQGMQERAAAIGGSVNIVSKPRRGTRVQASLLIRRAPSP
jgi:PAS domain S-box-containing protein